MYASKYGMVFENNVHEQLKKTNFPVYTEREIINMFGNHITAIDHMIVNDDFFLCIQDKYCKDPINISQTNHFMQTVNSVSQILNKPCIGIYLSKSKLSGPSNNAFMANNQFNINQFIEINGNTEKELIDNLTEYLYSIKIYMYDDDGDCIMLNKLN
jgi:hypothetical protein